MDETDVITPIVSDTNYTSTDRHFMTDGGHSSAWNVPPLHWRIGIEFAVDTNDSRLTLAFIVSSRKVTNFRLEPEVLDALHVIKERDGIPIVEQARRALRAWIEERGITMESKADRLRAPTRRRP